MTPEPDGYTRLTITLPTQLATALRGLAERGRIPSVSGYLAESAERRLGLQEWHERWEARMAESGAPEITPEAMAWAEGLAQRAKRATDAA